MFSGKIRVTVPSFVGDIIDNDIEDFQTNKNEFFNNLFKNWDFEFKDKKFSYDKTSTKLIQFQLSKKNLSTYYDMNQKFKNIYEHFSTAEYFRQMYISYISLIKVRRERIIFRDIVEKIEKAIESNKVIRISANEKSFDLEPYFIKDMEKETRTYLCSYCLTSEQYRAFRIVNINSVKLLSLTFKNRNPKYIMELEENFDPFLSYGSFVKVRLSNEGINKYNRIITNRPKLVEKISDNVWKVEASEFKAELFFSGFLDDVEIIEPINLRNKIYSKLKKAVDKYEIDMAEEEC